MDVKIKEAVHGGIEKWDRIIDGTGEDTGCANCPLCHEFNSCKECLFNCGGGTSYKKWIRHQRTRHKDGFEIYCPKCRELAIAVRDDLKKLLEG